MGTQDKNKIKQQYKRKRKRNGGRRRKKGRNGRKTRGATLSNEFSVSRLIEILKLTTLREKLGLRPPRPRPTSPADKTFRKLLKKPSEIVASWDSRLYLVYLHSFERYNTGREHDVYFRDFVLQTAAELKIPAIDVHREVFTPHEDPLSLFPDREARHYNAEGYRLIAEAIAKRLTNDGLFR